MPSRFFLKLLILLGLWASLAAWGAAATSVAVASSLQASTEMRAIIHYFRGANFQRGGEINEALEEYRQAVRLA